MSKLNSSRKEPSAGVQAWYTYCPVYQAGNVDGDWAGKKRNSESGRGGDTVEVAGIAGAMNHHSNTPK